MTLTRACSVASPGDVPGIRLLAAALAEHHPGIVLTVAALPGARRMLAAIAGIEVVAVAELDPARFAASPVLPPTPALAALARPLLLRRMLALGTPGVLLLAADCEVRGPLEAIEAALEEAEVVLLSRVSGGLPDDGERPDAEDLLSAGEIDDEIVAVRDGSHAVRFVTWWLDRVADALGAVGPIGTGRVAPSPLGAAARALDGVTLLADQGYGVGAWNFHERPLSESGEVLAGGRPLRLMRFAGFRADRPWWLSEYASRVRVLDDPVLAALCSERAQALVDAGWKPPVRGDETTVQLAGELRLDERLNRLLLEAADAGEDFGDVEDPVRSAALMAWLDEPAAVGAGAGVNRYSYDVWLHRDDLQRAYPDLDGADVDGFIGWLWIHGRGELKLDVRLLPAPPDWVPDLNCVPPAVEVLGYLRGNLGLGQAARGYVAALRAGGVPVATRTVPLDGPGDERGIARRRADELHFEDATLERDPDVLLVCVNAPQLPGLIDQLGREAFEGRHVIGQWGWEVDAIPSYWEPSFALVDEIWVYSRYVADLIAPVSPKPVVVVPLPVEAPTDVATDHGLALPPGDFTFLFAFDFLSTVGRKNPVGLIEAFKRAFAPGEGPRLVLKTTNARFRGELHDRLRHATDRRPDIAIVDVTLTPPRMSALLAQADCYVSLHRAEGFGLTLAESMILGKPVIATRFSGNLDFMSAANSHLVDYELTEVGPEGEHYPAAGIWAEPSLEHAAYLMREVWEDKDAARALGDRARRDVEVQLHPSAVGAIARRRLRHLPIRAGGVAPSPPPPQQFDELEQRLRFDLLRGASASGRARDLVRRSALRAMRPYSHPQRRFDEALVAAVRRLGTEVEQLRAARERDRDRIARLDGRVRRSLDAAAPAYAELAALTRASSERVKEVAQSCDRLSLANIALDARLQPLVAGAEAIPWMDGQPFETFEHPVAGRVLGFRDTDLSSAPTETAYRRFEDIFRGSRERVRTLLERYVDLLRGYEPVLDVGAGRGELLELLRDAGMAARGVELDPGMADGAVQQGLDVIVADGIEYLESLEPGSLGAVTAIHVIEHLPHVRLERLLAAAGRAVRPSGLVVCETVNPHAGFALKTFWVDPSHRHPVFPETLLLLALSAGLPSAFVTHLRGTGDVDRDRFNEDSYTLVAAAPPPAVS